MTTTTYDWDVIVDGLNQYLRLRSIPIGMKLFESVVIEGLAALSRNGLRYPIPPYGIQSDAAAGLAVSYSSKQ
jgi:hypothetical protein